MPLLRLGLHLGWLALSFALQTSSLVVPDVVCESFLGRRSCLLSLLLLVAGLVTVEPLLVWLLCLFLGRLRFPWRVLPLVILRGSATFLAPVS